MQKSLYLILEYERARREMKRISDQIPVSIYDGFAQLKCLSPVEVPGNVFEPCITSVWEYNKLDSEYQDELEEPWLCESCRVTQSLIDQRKAAKKRFGIAKMRISRNAAEYLKSVGEK